MRRARFGHVLRAIVGAALASSSTAAAVAACETASDVPTPSADAGADGADATRSKLDPDAAALAAQAFADEATYACDPPLPNMLANLTPTKPVDYLELRTHPRLLAA